MLCLSECSGVAQHEQTIGQPSCPRGTGSLTFLDVQEQELPDLASGNSVSAQVLNLEASDRQTLTIPY